MKNKEVKDKIICKYCKISFSRNDILEKQLNEQKLEYQKQLENKNKQIEKLNEKQVRTISNNNEQ